MFLSSFSVLVYVYSHRAPSLNSGETQNLSFCKGVKLLESGCVENVLQVGEYRPIYTIKIRFLNENFTFIVYTLELVTV